MSKFMILLFGAATLASSAAAVQATQPQQAPDPEQLLKHFVVVDDTVKGRKPLPKIGVLPSLASAMADVTLHSVVRRDLDLCGEFQVLPANKAPEGLYLSDSPVDVAAWKKKGAESVVKVSAKKLPSGQIELSGLAYFTDVGDKPVYDKRIVVAPDRVRAESHRITDALIGALTGTPGGFSSQMTFIYGMGKQRRAYVMDADGHEPHAVSPDGPLALSPAFGPGQKVYYAASVKKDAFKVFSPGSDKPLVFKPRGSVYGIAFSSKRDQVAVSIAQGPTIKMYRGPDFLHLSEVADTDMALHPAWSPSGKLAFSGAGKWGQRIYVDGKAVSPAGLNASAPVFCRHPDGIRLVYMVGVGKNHDLVASAPTGGSLRRLTQGSGRNRYPACSPDGRLVAFFSTRKHGQGPGLYVMRIDGSRAKRISTLLGDSLRWARLPEKK